MFKIQQGQFWYAADIYMKISLITKLLTLTVLLISVSCASFDRARGMRAQDKRARETQRLQKERQEEATAQYHEAVKRHQKIQSKEVRKRLRKNDRSAHPANETREPFFKRIF